MVSGDMARRTYSPSHSKLNVFSYGSNMSLPRLRERIASPSFLHTGYVPQRKLAFHKHGADGSAKCDAWYTGSDEDCVWGVIYRISHRDIVALDRFEWVGVGYHREEVDVIVGDHAVPAYMYVAHESAINDQMRPYTWYHQLVVSGAREHGLPDSYIDHLTSVEAIADPDADRDRHHRRLINTDQAPG